jgi:hypothetical protein
MTETLEEESMCVELYLTKQQPVALTERELECLFCRKSRGVDWSTSIQLSGKLVLLIGVCESCRVNLKPNGPPERPGDFVHVDDFIDHHLGDQYARFVLDYFRRSAVCQRDFWPFMIHHRLFCTFKDTVGGGKRAGRYRVTGASRMGDIWLVHDFECETGYDHRVNVADCHEWSGQP